MKIIIIISSLLAPAVLYLLQKSWNPAKWIINTAATLSALVFGNIASLAIYEIIQDHTVFMTHIHAVFLNPFFLLTGSYLGVYLLYRLLLLTLSEL